MTVMDGSSSESTHWPQSDQGRVMGISMALFEETTYDPHNRCTNQQQPRRVHHDSERRIASVCAAITEAVHHATGLRVRELPSKD